MVKKGDYIGRAKQRPASDLQSVRTPRFKGFYYMTNKIEELSPDTLTGPSPSFLVRNNANIDFLKNQQVNIYKTYALNHFKTTDFAMFCPKNSTNS